MFALLLAVPLGVVAAGSLWVVGVARRAIASQCAQASSSAEEAFGASGCTGGGFFARHKVFLVVFGVTTLIWLGFFLVCYPGIFSKDSADVIAMMSGAPIGDRAFRYTGLNDHHPLLYSFFNGIILKVGEVVGLAFEARIAMVSFSHMVCLAASCSYCTSVLHRLTRSRMMVLVCVLFFAFDPLIAFYSVTVWKDVLFGAALLALLSLSVKIITSPDGYEAKRARFIPFLLLTASCMLLRSNGIVVGLAVIICVALFVNGGALRRAAWASGVCALIVFALVKGPLCWVLSVQPAHFAESVSLPLQQIGCTVAEGGSISDEQKAFLDQIMPWEEFGSSYDPQSVNGIKFNAAFNDAFLESHKADFFRTWIELGLQNPGAYLRAWCGLTECYWYVNGPTWYLGDVGYDVDGDGRGEGADRPSWLVSPQTLYAFCETYITVFEPLFKPASLAWTVLFLLMAGCWFRSRASIVSSIPLVMYWATFLIAAPATDFRYVFPILLCVPLVVASLVLLPSASREDDASGDRASSGEEALDVLQGSIGAVDADAMQPFAQHVQSVGSAIRLQAFDAAHLRVERTVAGRDGWV